MNANLIYQNNTILGEGPLWDFRIEKLVWVDIMKGLIHFFDPKTNNNTTHLFGHHVSAIVMREKGGYVLACDRGFAFYNPDNKQVEWLDDPEEHKKLNRFNDGKCDPQGRFWAGTMEFNAGNPNGALYCLEADLSWNLKLDNIYVSNGMDWSADATEMYYIDSPTRKIQCYSFDARTGNIVFKKNITEIPESLGFPDGMTVDENGNLWVAIYRAGKVQCFNAATGQLIEEIQVPTSLVSSCCFGGNKLDTLFITTIAEGNEEDPLAGGLFAIKPGVKGVHSNLFKG